MILARSCALLKYMGVGLIVIFGGGLSSAFAQDANPEAPVVTAGAVPLYPRTALLVHIQGVVKIRVTTDGKRISSLDGESGPPMLVQAAKENIRSWQFEEHKPTTFFVTFQYRIEDPPQCSVGNTTAVLHLPSDIQISANRVHTCDPVSPNSSGEAECQAPEQGMWGDGGPPGLRRASSTLTRM